MGGPTPYTLTPGTLVESQRTLPYSTYTVLGSRAIAGGRLRGGARLSAAAQDTGEQTYLQERQEGAARTAVSACLVHACKPAAGPGAAQHRAGPSARSPVIQCAIQ